MKLPVGQAILGANDRVAGENRADFARGGVFVVNLMSAPGSGKTAILERTLAALAPQRRVGVIEGDVQGRLDAERLLRVADVPVVQINTDPVYGGECHLDARMIRGALPQLALDALDLVIVENVGNIVCPAEFDIGEDRRVMVLSVTEGEDKPLKYPLMFRVADALLLNKVDLVPALGTDLDAYRANVARVNPQLPVFALSARTGEGFDAWLAWLAAQTR